VRSNVRALDEFEPPAQVKAKLKETWDSDWISMWQLVMLGFSAPALLTMTRNRILFAYCEELKESVNIDLRHLDIVRGKAKEAGANEVPA